MAKSKLSRAGRKLITFALNGFYAFDDDEIEDKIDEALIRFKSKGRKAVRAYIWSFPAIRNKICDIANKMFNS